jgi:hypothetical protein
LAHPKTIEAYSAAGINYKDFHEKGTEVAVREKKKLVEKDPNKKVVVGSVYRIKIDDGFSEAYEVITWDQQTIGHTGLGNLVSYHENTRDLCTWQEPITTKETRFNPETEQTETITKPDISEVKTHYLYPFNKENIAMIEKLTKNNRKCNFAVMDNQKGISRSVDTFEEWSTKPFDSLIIRRRNQNELTELGQLLSEHQRQERQEQQRLQQYH